MEKNYSYEVTEDGYYILINGKKVIHQYEPYIPNKELSYEENAKAQIAEMQEADKQSAKEQVTMESLKTRDDNIQEQVTNIELALAEIYENGGTN